MSGAARNATLTVKRELTPSWRVQGHKDFVLSAAFFHDGCRPVTGSQDKTMKIWDVQKGTLMGELEGHKDGVDSISISPDDRRIVSGGSDSRIVIWDVAFKEKVFDLLGRHDRWVKSVCFSPDGKRFASTGDGKVIIWDTETGTARVTIDAHDGYASDVVFSPDGQKLASGSPEQVIRVWHTDTAELLLEINDAHHGIVWSPCSQKIISGSPDHTVKFWDASNGDQIGKPCEGHTDNIRGLAISPDGSFIVTGSDDNSVRLWSTKTHKQMGPSLPHNNYLRCVAISPDGKLLACGDFGAEISLWYIWGIVELHFEQEKEHEEFEVEQRLAINDGAQAPGCGLQETELKDLTFSITKVEDHPVARGGFGEVWKCIYNTDGRHLDVAVKTLLVYVDDAMEKKSKRIRRELRICAKLKHPNILPVYGYTYDFGPLMAIVSPWAENGNLTAYLDENTTLGIVRRFQILSDITAGLQYLHANNVIHGDLNGPNVLIYGDGTACLADFGLSLMYSEVISISVASWTSSFHGNTRWLAPELLGQPDDELPVRPSGHSDIYSFGGIMLLVLTNKVPYHHLGDAGVILSLGTGVKPSRSRYPPIPDKYWNFIKECWSTGAQDRPSIERVVEVVKDELGSLSSAHANS